MPRRAHVARRARAARRPSESTGSGSRSSGRSSRRIRRSANEPNFDATNPNAYPPGAWDRYDLIVRLRPRTRHRRVLRQSPHRPPLGRGAGHADAGLSVVATSPRSRTTAVRRGGRPALQRQLRAPRRKRPRTSAGPPVAARPPRRQPSSAPAPPPALPRGQLLGHVERAQRRRVAEPAVPLQRTRAPPLVPRVAPATYRRLVDVGYSAPRRHGHAGDTILIGETASHGTGSTRSRSCATCTASVLEQPPAARQRRAALAAPPRATARSSSPTHPGLFASRDSRTTPTHTTRRRTARCRTPDLITLAEPAGSSSGL